MKSIFSFLSVLAVGIFMALPLALNAQVSSIKYYINYNSTLCNYEAHMVVTGGSATGSQLDAGKNQFSIVVPTGATVTKVADNQPRTKASSLVTPSVWSTPNVVLHPTVTPLVDYYGFTMAPSPAAAYPTLGVSTDLVLFTFTVSPNNCGVGLRMWRNNNDDLNPDPGPTSTWDPSGGASGMAGGDFNNSMTIGSTTELYIQGNATSNVTPPSPAINLVTPACVANTFSLTATATPGSLCAATLSYAWTGPGSFTATGASFTRTSATSAMTGTYRLTVTDNNGCSAAFARGYNALTCSLTPLAIKLSSFDGTANKCVAVLNWQSSETPGIQNFEVQYSGDGVKYETVGVVNAGQSEGGVYIFRYNQNGGKGYYRLKVVDEKGDNTYSQTVVVTTDCNNQIITVSPNPTTGVINVKGVNAGDEVKVVDMLGQTVTSVIATGSVATTDLSRFPAAVYMVIVTQGHNVIKVGQIVNRP